jgi:hypothetical protein
VLSGILGFMERHTQIINTDNIDRAFTLYKAHLMEYLFVPIMEEMEAPRVTCP